MTTTLNGADFVAVVRLTDKPGNVLAKPGESCADVPSGSLGWLERSGKIRRREPEDAVDELVRLHGDPAAEPPPGVLHATEDALPTRKGRSGRRSS